MKTLLLSLFFIVACNPVQGDRKLVFKDLKQEEIDTIRRKQDAIRQSEIAKEELKKEKIRVMEEIIKDAKASFEDIKPLMVTKCFDCHDSNTKTPAYGRVLPNINPVYKHQVEGIKAVDFADIFPLKSKANSPQLSLLKSIRNQVIDREMPLKSYTMVYRSKRIFKEDEEKILAWVDPIIARLEDYAEKYESPTMDPAKEALKVMELKCFRCHANGIAKGRFGDMEKTEELLKSKYVNLNNPEDSDIYRLSENGKMPPNKREALTEKELFSLREWLILESRKAPVTK